MRNFLLPVSFIVSAKVCIFPLNMCDTIIYVARWWEKYLSKRSPLKDTCSWRDKPEPCLTMFFGWLKNLLWKIQANARVQISMCWQGIFEKFRASFDIDQKVHFFIKRGRTMLVNQKDLKIISDQQNKVWHYKTIKKGVPPVMKTFNIAPKTTRPM